MLKLSDHNFLNAPRFAPRSAGGVEVPAEESRSAKLRGKIRGGTKPPAEDPRSPRSRDPARKARGKFRGNPPISPVKPRRSPRTFFVRSRRMDANTSARKEKQTRLRSTSGCSITREPIETGPSEKGQCPFMSKIGHDFYSRPIPMSEKICPFSS